MFVLGCQPSDRASEVTQQTLEGNGLATIGVTVLLCKVLGADTYTRGVPVIRQFADSILRWRLTLGCRSTCLCQKAITAVRQAVLACSLTCVKMLSYVRAETRLHTKAKCQW
ncbi:MAG: hypothetical protein ACE5NW_11820 [Acidiferrobacterales bacterium]